MARRHHRSRRGYLELVAPWLSARRRRIEPEHNALCARRPRRVLSHLERETVAGTQELREVSPDARSILAGRNENPRPILERKAAGTCDDARRGRNDIRERRRHDRLRLRACGG